MWSARRTLLGDRSVNTPLQQYGEDVFSLWSLPRGYLEDILDNPGSSRAVFAEISQSVRSLEV
jgi:hypothetical protein